MWRFYTDDSPGIKVWVFFAVQANKFESCFNIWKRFGDHVFVFQKLIKNHVFRFLNYFASMFLVAWQPGSRIRKNLKKILSVLVSFEPFSSNFGFTYLLSICSLSFVCLLFCISEVQFLCSLCLFYSSPPSSCFTFGENTPVPKLSQNNSFHYIFPQVAFNSLMRYANVLFCRVKPVHLEFDLLKIFSPTLKTDCLLSFLKPSMKIFSL